MFNYTQMLPPLTRFPQFFMGQMGVPGSDAAIGMRNWPQSVVYHVDFDHPLASNNNDGTDPEAPLASLQTAVNKVSNNFDWIIVRSFNPAGESVITGDYDDFPSYVRIIGPGATRYSPQWIPVDNTHPNISLGVVGWTLENFRITPGSGVGSCGVELHHTDVTGNDIAIRTQLIRNYFDGLTTARYGILSHGCYDVCIAWNTFSLFHNAVAGGAVPMLVGTTPLAIPYRNHMVGNMFYDCDNGAIWPSNGSFWYGQNIFQPVGYAYSMTQVLNTSIIGNPGDDNIVTGNTLPGDYSIAGGYNPGAADVWIGNFADDVLEPEVGDNGLTIARPV